MKKAKPADHPAKRRLSPKDKEILRLNEKIREMRMIMESQGDELVRKDETINAFQQRIYRLEEAIKNLATSGRIKEKDINKTYPIKFTAALDSSYFVPDIQLKIPSFDPQGRWTDWVFNAPVLLASGKPVLFRVLWDNDPVFLQHHISDGKPFDCVRYSLDEYGGVFLSLGLTGKEWKRI